MNDRLTYLKEVLKNSPKDWLHLTTHRLDIYDEKLAKSQFLTEFEHLFQENNFSPAALKALPTAYDYIRLGHPLSCLLEWALASAKNISAENVISFSSKTIPVFAILRKNLLSGTHTRILYTDALPSNFNTETLKKVYGYQFEIEKIETNAVISNFEGSTILISQQTAISKIKATENIDFSIHLYGKLGSILIVNSENQQAYISEIQHVRRRETIAMTPINCLQVLNNLVENTTINLKENITTNHKTTVLNTIKTITGTTAKPLVGSSGLSIQYAIMMGLIADALEKHPEKAIKIIVPPNCYGGTNDQARRVAACLKNVDVVDLPVDGANDMVQSINLVLNAIAAQDAIPYIIAEIPTNPRVEVPNLLELKAVLSAERKTASGTTAIAPVFILDQTFCPNVHFLGEGEVLAGIKTISYASGSKFPSGGLCTAGYCVGNEKARGLLEKIESHLQLCDNEATDFQLESLANQMPSMNQRIYDAYVNTRKFVTYIEEVLPTAKINFVSESLAKEGFTPSVFSLDLPTKGATDKEKESYKRALNLKLINLMITEIPTESKFCVSYGQLKGCYWTIPATSTQGTTKEGDKDYIVRVSLSGAMDLALHKKVFLDFVKSM